MTFPRKFCQRFNMEVADTYERCRRKIEKNQLDDKTRGFLMGIEYCKNMLELACAEFEKMQASSGKYDNPSPWEGEPIKCSEEACEEHKKGNS